jgi:hypothetical protein
MRIIRGLVSVLSLSALVACGGLDLRDDDVVVKERSQARWDALVKGDISAAYEYLSPGSRAAMTRDAYASSMQLGFWKSAKVDSVTCATKDNCEAHATIEYEFQGRKTKTPLRETWIREGSQWWYLQR